MLRCPLYLAPPATGILCGCMLHTVPAEQMHFMEYVYIFYLYFFSGTTNCREVAIQYLPQLTLKPLSQVCWNVHLDSVKLFLLHQFAPNQLLRQWSFLMVWILIMMSLQAKQKTKKLQQSWYQITTLKAPRSFFKKNNTNFKTVHMHTTNN